MKVMLLTVSGGGAGDYVINTWRRIVSVEDEIQFLATMRLIALKELAKFMETVPTGPDYKMRDLIAQGLMKSLKLRLTDLGLTEYPESPEDQVALYRRVFTGETNETTQQS